MPRSLWAVILVAALAPRTSAAGPYDDLLPSVPPGTNALVLINVKAAYASPLGQADKWAGDHYQRYRSGIGFVPPEAEAVVIAADVNLASMNRGSQLGLVKLRNPVAMAEVVRREAGILGEIQGRQTAYSPRDVYYTTLPGVELAAIYPADRQATARWIKHALASKGADLSPYLKQAVAGAGNSTLVIALDMTNAVEPGVLKLGLAVSPAVVKNKVADLDLLARIAASVKGLTLQVSVTNKITGTIQIDFDNDPTLMKQALRDLFLETIDDHGIGIAGLDSWETSYTNRSMTLSGALTMPDLRRLLSLFAFPGTGSDEGAGEGDTPNATATKRYLAAVDVVLTDLGHQKDSVNYNKTATWHDKAADQIDHLSRRGVDPIAVKAGIQSAARLRAIAQSLRGVPINTEALNKTAYYNTSVNWGVAVGWHGIRPYWTGNSVSTNYPEVRAKIEKVIAEDKAKRGDAWVQIAQIMGDAKGALQEKYKTKF